MPPKSNKFNKFWKFVNLNDDETELQLYSDIASRQSEDWWSGEKGDEVTPKLFREELNAITSKNICVRINSNGGDVFAAQAIATCLKECSANGKTVNCKIDGICASAAVMVALACEHISIANGAYMMIHKPFSFAYGYYNADEFEKSMNALNKIQEGIVDAYVARTGLSEKECNKLINQETWLTAKEAVEKGFADEIMFVDGGEEENDEAVMNRIRTAFVASAVASDITKVPKALKKAFENKNFKEEGEKPMEIKNYEDLKTAHPELVKNAENKAREDGEKSERERLQALDSLSGKIDATLLNEAKYGAVKMTADEVIVKAFKEDKMSNKGYMNAAKNDAEENDEVKGEAEDEDLKNEEEDEAKNAAFLNIAKNIRNNGGKK